MVRALLLAAAASLLAGAALACQADQPGFPPVADDQAYQHVKQVRRSGRLNDAMVLLGAYLKDNPGHFHATHDLALAHLTKGEDAAGERLLIEAVSIRESAGLCEAGIFNTAGYHFLARDRLEEAETYLDMGLRGHTFVNLDRHTQRRLLVNAAITKARLGKACESLSIARVADAYPDTNKIGTLVLDLLGKHGISEGAELDCIKAR